MPKVNMRVHLLDHTPAPVAIGNIAASVCYSGKPIEEIIKRQVTSTSKSLKSAMDSGHTSILEHMTFTFAVSGVSRALLAQITRHRIASFSVQSQRYVSMGGGFDYVVPPSIEALGEEAAAEFVRQMETMEIWYAAWQERLGNAGERSNEDARFVLPNACATQFVFTMNARELLHFFSLRCCARAQWEIRNLATQMLHICREVIPEIFEFAGPACIKGKCPEGKRSCGHPWDMEKGVSHEI